MSRILVLYAHPAQRHSRVNAAMAARAATLEHISFIDLYAEYPRFKIDVDKEQQRLSEHDIILMQFPLMWYSTPSLLKEWQDLVLEYGFAYGPDGTALKGKRFGVAISAGSPQESYSRDSYQNRPVHEYLAPLTQLASLCHMQALPPFVLFDSLAEQLELNQHVAAYSNYLQALRDQTLDLDALAQLDFIDAAGTAKLLENPHG